MKTKQQILKAIERCSKMCKDVLTLITEQEKEIERLKAEVKQAKIDVLNELKKQMFEREYMGVKYRERIFYESDIDEMIEEIENEN